MQILRFLGPFVVLHLNEKCQVWSSYHRGLGWAVEESAFSIQINKLEKFLLRCAS
jgi:hypothetical protein